MKLAWTDDGWDDYVYWQTEDKRTLKKINSLIKSINRDGPLKGEGHPEPLKYRPGYSRTINEKDRLVYDIQDGELVIFPADRIMKTNNSRHPGAVIFLKH